MIDLSPLFAVYAAWRQSRLDRLDPVSTQDRQLKALVARAANTAFGRDHDFARIASVADFQARVPLASFVDLDEAYWKGDFPRLEDRTWPGRIPFFAATSGTSSGVTKMIPVSREMLVANRRAALDILVYARRYRGRGRFFGGKSLMLGGSTDLGRLSGGARRGDLSGIAALTVPWWVRPFVEPPSSVALMSDWDRKTDVMVRRSLNQDIRVIGGSANWLLLFLTKVMALDPSRGNRLGAFYPNLELVVHGGMDFRPYRGEFARLLADSQADLREVYPASEGFIAIADRGYGEGLRLILDNGLFFEFVPVGELHAARPTRHWVGTVEPGIDYVVVLSTCAGLWAYVLGDTLRFIDRAPPRVLITGRTSYFLSAFGEHLSGEQIDHAVFAAVEALGAPLHEFTVGPLFPGPGQRAGRHLYLIEFAGPPPPAGRFAEAIDTTLQRANLDYRDIRAGDFGLLPPLVEAVPPGTFVEWMRRRGKLGGQHKVPRVVTDPAMLAELRQMVESRG